MRIALINSPSSTVRPVSRSMAGGLGFDGNDEMVLPPLDLAIMAATLRKAGETVDLIDADPLRLDVEGVCERLGDRAWDLFIATASLPTWEQDASFLAELRRRYPKARVFGKTLVREQTVLQALLQRSGADVLIHGEADLSIVDLIHDRSRSGTAWLEPGPNGAEPVLKFEPGEPVHDLDQLPFPARDLLPNALYRYPLLGGPVATLQTSRGCPYPCRYYCPYPLVEGTKWRAQGPERVFAELKEIVEGLGITKIYFRDATFTLKQQRIERLCELIIAARWDLEWVCETRVDCLSDALLEKMRAAGCVGLLVGVETGDETVMSLREVKKGLTVPKLARLREQTRQLGIRLHFLLIVGLPQETRESIVATYDLIQRYQPDTIGVTIITPYPGTPLYAEGLRAGWIDSLQWRDYGGHQVPMHTPNLTRDDLIDGKRFLEEGFAILQRRLVGGRFQPLEAIAGRHYQQLLRWAYQLDDPIAKLREAARLLVSPTSHQPGNGSVRPEDRCESGSPAPSGVSLSVVIPTYNRCAILRKTLVAFSAQTISPDRFEVIVADDGSSDDTIAMLKQFTAPFALKVVTQAHQGANAARNQAIRAAQGEIVLLTGDDMIPEPSFVESHLQFHRQHPSELEAMLGFIDWSPEITITPFMRFLVSPEGGQQFAFHEVENGKADFRLFYTSNVSVKRSLLLKQAILFDTDFAYPAYDDIELGYRLTRQGMQLHYNPRAVTRHHHEMSPEGFVQRQRNAGRMAVILADKHPELDKALLGVQAILSSPSRTQQEVITRLLSAVRELDKPDREALARIRVQGTGLDQFYAQQVLYPVYHALLRTAYELGVIEGAEIWAAQRRGGQRSGKPFEASIIIPVFNKVELTRQCLTSLASVTQGVDYEVIVVDNASTDGTASFLATLSGDIRIIRNSENAGFAKACNQGVRAAQGRYLVFLNNDAIPRTGWLKALIDEVEEHPEVAVVGSKLLYPDGTIQHAGVAFSRVWFAPYHVYRGFPENAPVVNRRREFQAVTAACMLVRRESFEAVGGFDEGYRNGFEDVDLCLKIRERGWRVVYQPKSVLYHLESQTPGRKAHEQENARRLRERWAHQWWLPDEDAIYVPDGYAYRAEEANGILRDRLELLENRGDRARWEVVAEAQRLAHRQDVAGLKQLLARADAWPRDRAVLRWAARVGKWIDAPDLAESFWRTLLTLEDACDARAALARAALTRGQPDEADAHLTALLANAPQYGEGWMLRGIWAMQRHDYAEAASAFERAHRNGGDPRQSRMGLGMAAMGLSDGELAWRAFSAVLADNPDDVEAAHWVLRVGTALERWNEVEHALRRFVQRNPGELAVRYAWAGVLLRCGRVEEARREAETIRLLQPDFAGLAELDQSLEAKRQEAEVNSR